MTTKICVYAICKNESKNVQNWIHRLINKDDHPELVVIVDTGSTDDTVAILQNEIADIVDKSLPEFVLRYTKSTGELFDENNINFSIMRNESLYYAYNEIRRMKDDPNNWVMISLDFDEIPNENFFSKIREIRGEEPFDVIKITGLTYNENVVSSQIVEHKVHSCNYNWKWVRRVHEIIQLTGIKQKEWKKLDGSEEIFYTHNQDLTKKRDYYSLLKKELMENPDSTTTIYCAWEAALHDEIPFSDVLNKKCKGIILSDTKDEHYHDWEYYIQCCLNLALHNKENVKITEGVTNKVKVLKVSIDELNEALAIMQDNRFPKLRRVFGELAYLYKEAGDIVLDELMRLVKHDCDYSTYESIIEELYEKSIHWFKEVLKIHNRPYCWIEDDYFYDNNHMYFAMININLSLLALYKEGEGNFDKHINVITDAIGYNTLLSNISEDLKRESMTKMINILSFYNNLKSKGSSGNTFSVGEEIQEIKDQINVTKTNEGESTETEMTEVKNRVAVYAICKNESQFVEKWMNSMMEADLVVVLDTGSTDNTLEELKKFESEKVQIYSEKIDPWRFDIARNIALDKVPKEYNILVSTDLDEILEPGWSNVLREKWVEGVHERGIYKYSWSHLENGESGRIFQYDKVHSRKWRWKYPVHELLYNVETGSNLYNSENTLYIFDEMHLHHYPDRTKSRSNYLSLLELRAKEDPNDYYGLVYLAHEYYYQGKYSESIRTLKDILERFSDQYTEVEKASCYLFMGDSYYSMDDKAQAIYNYLNAIFVEPTYREPYLNLAKVYLDLKQYELAEEYVKLGIRNSYRHYTWLERDNSWSWEPYDLLSLACFYGGKKRDSLAHAVKAYQFDPENERLQKNVNVILENMTDEEFIQ